MVNYRLGVAPGEQNDEGYTLIQRVHSMINSPGVLIK